MANGQRRHTLFMLVLQSVERMRERYVRANPALLPVWRLKYKQLPTIGRCIKLNAHSLSGRRRHLWGVVSLNSS